MFSAIDADAQKSKTLKKFKKTNQESISKTIAQSNFDPALPSNYYSNVGFGLQVPTWEGSANYIAEFGGEIAFTPKSKLDIYTGFWSNTYSSYYSGSSEQKIYFSDIIVDYRHLLIKRQKGSFKSLELDVGANLPIGQLGLDGNEHTLGLRLGLMAGFQATKALYLYPFLKYTYSFNTENLDAVTRGNYDFGVIIPVKLSHKVFVQLTPIVNYLVLTSNYSGYPEMTNSVTRYDQQFSINYVAGKTVVLSGVVLSLDDFEYNLVGFTASIIIW
jgi:hypothetical protein